MSASRRPPNFAALRAFEAAARHENFSRAADELALTHGAISHQVRALERELGRPLFVRNGRQIRLCSDAREFAHFLGKSFAEIASAADVLRASASRQRLTMGVLPWFAARWLAPRLGRFIERYPEFDVVLQSSEQPSALERADIDLSIRYGRGHYPGRVVQPLMGDVWYPVVSTHYGDGVAPATPQALHQHTLLRSHQPWSAWLSAAGVALAEPTAGVLYAEIGELLHCAVEGHGVALVRHVVALPEIAAGRLRRLFDTAVPCAEGYYMVSSPDAAERPPVQALRAWLLEEAALFQRQADEMTK